MAAEQRKRAPESYPVFARKVSFENAFPEIEDLKIEVLHENETYPQNFSKIGFPGERINCRNPICHGGGCSIGNVLRAMVKDKKAEFEGLELCQGQEGSPKGRRLYRTCLRRFEVKVTIRYKAGVG